MSIRKYSLIAGLAVMWTLTGCDSPSTEQVQTPIPERVRTIAITADGTLSAFLYCNEQRNAMSILNNVALGSCTALPLGTSYTVRVEYEFTSNLFNGTYIIASVEQNDVQASPEGVEVNFLSSDLNTDYDNDADGLTNIEELELNQNPGNPACVLGISTLGSCVL